MSFTVICMYRPPSAKDSFYSQLETILNHCSSIEEVILMGDLIIKWDNASDRKKLKQLVDKYTLTQIINGPTRVTHLSRTTTDLMFTNRPDRIMKEMLH